MLNQTMLTDSSKKLWKQKNIIERESTKENQLNKGYGLQKVFLSFFFQLLKTAKQIPGDSLILITKFPWVIWSTSERWQVVSILNPEFLENTVP